MEELNRQLEKIRAEEDRDHKTIGSMLKQIELITKEIERRQMEKNKGFI